MSFQKINQALKEGNVSKVKDSIVNGGFDDGDLEQAVSLAVYHKQPEILKVLLESGVSPNAVHLMTFEDAQIQVYPLSLACRLAPDIAPRLIHMLIQHGARVDYPMYGRYVETSISDPQVTPIIHMLHNSKPMYLMAFLDAGIDPLYMHSDKYLPTPSKVGATHNTDLIFEPRCDSAAHSAEFSDVNTAVDALNIWHYLVFHLQYIDAKMIKELLHAGGIVPETDESAIHSISLRYMMYVTQDSHVSARIVENLLLWLLDTNFRLREEEFIALLYERFRKENGNEGVIPELVFDPCRPDRNPVYQQQTEALSSVDELFVTTMWNLKIYVKRLELTPHFLELFFERIAKPKSLMNLSRLVIRSSLGRIKLRVKIEQLPLPNDLKQYVYRL